MPPSSPSEQALTRRDNEDHNPSHALRSASRSTRRVANRRAPKQESEASGHGHPSTTNSPTIPRSKSSRGRTTSGRVAKRAAATTKAKCALQEGDGNSKNVSRVPRQDRTSSVRHPMSQDPVGPVENFGPIKAASIIAEKNQFSMLIEPGVPLPTTYIPAKHQTKPSRRCAETRKEDVSVSGVDNASLIISAPQPAQEKFKSACGVVMGSSSACGAVMGSSRCELSMDLSRTHPFQTLTLSAGLLEAADTPRAQAHMQFTASEVIVQPVHHEYSRTYSMSTSPTSSTHTSNKSIYTPASSLAITASAIPESTQTFKANILPGFSSARLTDPSSSSVLAKRASSMSLSPNSSVKSQGQLTSTNSATSSSSSLMDKAIPYINFETHSLTNAVVIPEIQTHNTNNDRGDVLVNNRVQAKQDNLNQSSTSLSGYESQGHILEAHVNGEDMKMKDVSGETESNEEHVNKFLNTPNLLANQIRPASFKFNDLQMGMGGKMLTSNVSADVDFIETHWSAAESCECEAIKHVLKNSALSSTDLPLLCKSCGKRVQIGKSQDLGDSLGEGSDMSDMSLDRVGEEARWWDDGNYYTAEMDKDMLQSFCEWGPLEHESELTFAVEDDDVPVLPDWYDGTDTIFTNIEFGPEELDFLSGS